MPILHPKVPKPQAPKHPQSANPRRLTGSKPPTCPEARPDPQGGSQWAALTEGKDDYDWHPFTKQRFMVDLAGNYVLYTKTGSIFDGLKEYLLLTHILPAEPKTESILFAKRTPSKRPVGGF